MNNIYERLLSEHDIFETMTVFILCLSIILYGYILINDFYDTDNDKRSMYEEYWMILMYILLYIELIISYNCLYNC